METTEIIREPRRLTRPHGRRWVGGVCAGLGEYFDLSPVVYRIAFAALALAGGTGILLYIAAWLVIPDEGADDSIVVAALRHRQDRPRRLVGLALLAFAVVVALSAAHVWPNPGNLWLAAALAGAALVWWQLGPRRTAAAATAGSPAEAAPPGPSLLPLTLGTLLIATGIVALLDLTGAWNPDWRIVLGAMVVLAGAVVAAGAATGRAVGAVAVLGVGLLAALALALAVRVPIFAGAGHRLEQPASIAALDRSYKLGIGDLTVDLTGVSLPAGETRVKATLGIGDLVVRVPSGVIVRADGRAGVGKVTLFGQEDDGTHVHERVTAPGAATGRVLVLDAHVGLGNVEVARG